jgi:hypothetical protein
MQSFIEAQADILKHFWIQVAVSLRAASEAKRPLRNSFGRATATNKFIKVICNGHSPTETSAHSGVAVM